MSQPQLFYSNRCTHSRQILQTLQTLNKSALVNAVCIDTIPRQQLPAYLKSVPTLYIPSTQDVLVGQAIYAYIAKPVAARSELPTAASGVKVSTQGPPQAGASGGDPSAWGFGGGGLTESYSMWDTPGQFSHTDQLQYTYLSGPSAGPPPASGTGSQNIQQRGDDADVASRLEKMRAQRDKEFTPVSRQ